MTTSNEAFEAWAFEQADFSTMQPWDVARSAWRAALSSASSGAGVQELHVRWEDALAHTRAAVDAAQGKPSPRTVAGALFDFLGFLTSRDQSVTLGSRELATPAADLLREWAATRGLPINDADVEGWSAILAATQRAEPVAQSGVGAETLAQWIDVLDQIHEESLAGRHEVARTRLLAITHEVSDAHRAALSATTAQRGLDVLPDVEADALGYARRFNNNDKRAALNAAPPAAPVVATSGSSGTSGSSPAPAAEAEPAQALDDAMAFAQAFGDAMLKRGILSSTTDAKGYAKSFDETAAAKDALRAFLATRLSDPTRPAAPLSEGDAECRFAHFWNHKRATFTTPRQAARAAFFHALTTSPSPQPTDEATDAGRGENTGHGHVRPRPDGVRARCGGPGICSVCSREAARLATPPDNAAGREGVK